MEEQERSRRIRKELFHDFKESAVGMMENIQEAEESAERLWDKFTEEIQKEIDQHRKK